MAGVYIAEPGQDAGPRHSNTPNGVERGTLAGRSWTGPKADQCKVRFLVIAKVIDVIILIHGRVWAVCWSALVAHPSNKCNLDGPDPNGPGPNGPGPKPRRV